MRFSGHETFPVREGWLYKGLDVLCKQPEKLFDEHAADYLGVGINMAKSIRHWLQATRLAETRKGKKGSLQATEFGRCVAENDPFFLESGTWWFLHINLINEPTYADTWIWFFNRFYIERFEKSLTLENLRQYLQLKTKKVPSIRTLERDIACLLSSYSRPVPYDAHDPEESRECPFRELGLMSYFRSSGYYQINKGFKVIPLDVFCYCMSMSFPEARNGDAKVDISLYDAVRSQGGPGRAFVLTSESLFDVILHIEKECSNDEVTITGLAGNKMIRLLQKQPIDWMKKYYASIKAEGKGNAA